MKLLLDVHILGLDQLLLLEDGLQLLVRLLIAQVPDLFLQGFNLGLGPLPDRSLGFSVVCPLLRQLLRGEIGDASRGGGRSAALLGGGGIGVGAGIVDDGVEGRRRMSGGV